MEYLNLNTLIPIMLILLSVFILGGMVWKRIYNWRIKDAQRVINRSGGFSMIPPNHGYRNIPQQAVKQPGNPRGKATRWFIMILIGIIIFLFLLKNNTTSFNVKGTWLENLKFKPDAFQQDILSLDGQNYPQLFPLPNTPDPHFYIKIGGAGRRDQAIRLAISCKKETNLDIYLAQRGEKEFLVLAGRFPSVEAARLHTRACKRTFKETYITNDQDLQVFFLQLGSANLKSINYHQENFSS